MRADFLFAGLISIEIGDEWGVNGRLRIFGEGRSFEAGFVHNYLL